MTSESLDVGGIILSPAQSADPHFLHWPLVSLYRGDDQQPHRVSSNDIGAVVGHYAPERAALIPIEYVRDHEAKHPQ